MSVSAGSDASPQSGIFFVKKPGNVQKQRDKKKALLLDFAWKLTLSFSVVEKS